jgi:RimJ/RimL family protein N-acetyltransferase
MEYEYRLCAQDDATAVLAFLTSLQSEQLLTITRMAELPSVEQEREWISRHMNGKGVVYAAMQGDRIIGLINALVLFPNELPGSCSFGVSVLSAHRRHGVATRLVNMLEQWAVQHQIERIELEVFGNNLNAIRLYENLGFVEDGRQVDALRLQNGEKADLIHMHKRTPQQTA